MAATVSVVFPIFAIILVGWLARRFGIVEAAGLRGLREVVFRLAMPALLFSSMVQAPGQPPGPMAPVQPWVQARPDRFSVSR